MKNILGVIRWVVGLLFIFSGLIKANDPLGLSYKMQEFFEVWNMPFFDDYTLALSVLMIAFEIIAGVAVIVGYRMKLVSWLLLLLILFFTFLTAYALFSGKIKTCGSFGDCIPLTVQTSFIKDLILLVLILILFYYRNRMKTFVSPKASIAVLLAATVFSFGIQWYVLVHLPVLDCLPYKKGNNISEKMKVPAGAVPDSSVITFVYQKQGKEVEFTADKFPADFNDTAYTFLKRYDKVVREGNAEPPIKDFVLNTPDGIDSTQEILATPGYMLLLFVKDEWNGAGYMEQLELIRIRANEKRIPLHLVTNNKQLAEKFKIGRREKASRPDKALLCDGVAIKTAARVNPTIYLLQHGTVTGKWSGADFDETVKILEKLN
ncbi:MAG: DoxX family protein [Chitinophagaceae bacterium]|nr:DoxX family protein [Chitinophagaceae bacterium]